jgi:DNA-damage-inducible protein D
MNQLVNHDNNQNLFESIKHFDQAGAEYWSARELMVALGYAKWENFAKTIKKAMTTAQKTNHDIKRHFPEVRKPLMAGNDAVQLIKDYNLSRYACYLVAMNGDSKKSEIALAQTYFAQATRKQELTDEKQKLERRLDARRKYTESDKRLSGVVMSHGVDGRGLAIIKSDGDRELFGGKNTAQMKQQYGLAKNQSLPDHLSPVVLAAKQLANEITSVNTDNKNLQGFQPIDTEHKTNNREVRKTLLERGVKPETLPPEEDIKKVKRRVPLSKKRQELS